MSCILKSLTNKGADSGKASEKFRKTKSNISMDNEISNLIFATTGTNESVSSNARTQNNINLATKKYVIIRISNTEYIATHKIIYLDLITVSDIILLQQDNHRRTVATNKYLLFTNSGMPTVTHAMNNEAYLHYNNCEYYPSHIHLTVRVSSPWHL